MTCDFCGCELPLLFASDNRDTLFDKFEGTECETGKYICLDLSNGCIYEFWTTKSVQPMDGYKHLCKKCAAGLDAFGSALLEKDTHRRVLNYRNIAANVLNDVRGKEMHPYMVAVEVGVKDQPVAQVFRKYGDRWVVINTIIGDAVGHLLTYMEGTTDA